MGRSETPRSKTPRDGHWPVPDGRRTVAVLAVIRTHVGILPGPHFGVDAFFRLSGFLITALRLKRRFSSGEVAFAAAANQALATASAR